MEAVADSQQQMSFEGIDVEGLTLGLKNASNLPCAKPMSVGEEGRGYVEYVTTGVYHSRNKDGSLVRHHAVEVLRFLSEA